jgi:very-short-patch-repair endonuclease
MKGDSGGWNNFMYLNYHYNKKLKTNARALRNNSTPGEIRIWCELFRARKMRGYQFLRQRPVGSFIADFMCKELNLIIEVDGYSHLFKYEKDIQRDKILKKLGFTTLRFSEQQVKHDLDNVCAEIESYIDNYELNHNKIIKQE